MALWKVILVLQFAAIWTGVISAKDHPRKEHQHWVRRMDSDGPIIGRRLGHGHDGGQTGGHPKRACINGGDSAGTPSGSKRIDQLQIGDIVQVEHEKYEPIIAFLHRDTSRSATGFKFTLETNNSVTLSDEHLVFVRKQRKAVFAKNVQVDDVMHLIQNGNTTQSRVIEVQRAQLEGRYSPLTPSGVLVVNDILVSCYSHVEDHHLMHKVIQWILPILPEGLFGAEWYMSKNGGMHWLGDALWYHWRHWFVDLTSSG